MRPNRTLAAVVMSLLLITAMPASVSGTGATNTAAIDHRTPSDFQTGTLTNMTIDGSGTGASVIPATDKLVDYFTNGDTSAWTLDPDWKATSTTAAHGSHSLRYAGSNTSSQSAVRTVSDDAYGELTFAWRFDSFTTESQQIRFQQGISGDEGPIMAVSGSGDVMYYDGSAWQTTTITLTTGTWYHVEVTPDYAADTYDIRVEAADGALIGTHTDASFRTSISGVNRIEALAVSNPAAYNIDNIRLRDANTNGTYTSDPHDVTDPTTAWTDLTLDTASATVTWQYHDGTQWVTHNRTQYVDTTANQTVDTSTQAADKWRTQVELTHFEHTLSSVWHFDDGSGTTATDSYGTRDGTLQNNAVWNTTAKVGSHSIDLIEGGRGVLGTGDSDYVSVPNKSSPRKEFTSGIWVYPRLDSTDRTIVGSSKSEDPDNIVLSRESDGSAGAFIPNVSSSRMEGGNLPLEEWSYVAIAYNGTHEALYVKNKGGQLQQVNSRPANGNVTEFGDILIGRSDTGDTGNNYDGLVDHPISHGRYLTLEELRYHVTNPTAYEGGRAELHDEGVEFTNHAPDASNLSPADGTTTEYEDVTFSADIDDTEFTDAEGDTVTVDLVVDGSVKDTQTLTSTGTYSQTLTLADGSYNWHLELSDTWGGSTTTTSRTLTVDHSAPELDNTSVNPSDGGQLTTDTVDLKIDVADEDFPKDGDTVTGDFYVKEPGSNTFTKVGSDTRTSNGTLIVQDYLADTGGQYEWYVIADDTYGYSTTSQTFAFSTPTELSIRNETDPDQLVKNTEITVTYYYGDEIQQLNTSDGTVNLTGLPNNQPIIARAKADGYHSRTAVIMDLYDQQSLYMLNDTTVQSHQLVFDLTDPTGAYPNSDTMLMIQRDINLSGQTEWRTVAGDVFGPQGVEADLEDDERYRLVIRNVETNDRSVLGAYDPVQSEEVTLEAEPARVELNASSDTILGYEASRNDAGDSIIVEYADPTDGTDTLKYRIYERNNASNEIVPNQTHTNLGNISAGHPLTASQQNTSWNVEYYWDKDGDGKFEGNAVVAVDQGPRQLIPAELDFVWKQSIGVMVLFITGLVFSERNLGAGALITAFTGALLWWVGLLAGITTGPAVVIAMGVAVFVHANDRGGGGGF